MVQTQLSSQHMNRCQKQIQMTTVVYLVVTISKAHASMSVLTNKIFIAPCFF